MEENEKGSSDEGQEKEVSIREGSIQQEQLCTASIGALGSKEAIQIGKASFSWGDIQHTKESLNINFVPTGSETNLSPKAKLCRSPSRKRGNTRELNNLRFNVNYDKGVNQMGPTVSN